MKVTDEQALGIVGIVTVGGFFMTTVLVLEIVVQAFVTSSLIVYVPALLNVNIGLAEVALVPPLNTEAPARSQFVGV